MRRWILAPLLVVLSIVLAFGVPLFLVAIAVSNAIDASPQPLIGMSYVFGAFLILLTGMLLLRLRRYRRRSKKGLVYSDSYLDAAELRSEVTLSFGTVVNLIYVIFKLLMAARYKTLLFAAEAVYYLVLSVIRVLLVFNTAAGRRRDNAYYAAWKSYRRCGWQLLLLELAMSFIILQSLAYSTDRVSLSAVVIGSALWAFYRLTMAVVQLVKFRGSERPFLSASKLINLSAALMSIYILQNTLLVHFAASELFRQRMNLGFGMAISAAVIAIAISMIVIGSGKLKSAKASV